MKPIVLTEAEQARLDERLDELGGLACVMSFRPELSFVAGPPQSPWCFSFNTAVVSAPINDLLDHSMDFCRGLTLHEAAHATVTRIFDLVRHDFFIEPEMHALFNSIEDCRIETWIKDRSPGAAPWIRLYNDRLFAPILHGPPIKSHATQFNMSILSKWWFGEEPKVLAPEVKKALDAVWPAIDKAIATQPPRIEMTSALIEQAYMNSRTLQFAYMRADMIDPPSDFEKLVRIRQLQMVHIVLTEVVPVYKELYDQDKKKQQKNKNGPSKQGDEDLQRFLQNMRSHHIQQSSGQGNQNANQTGQGRQTSSVQTNSQNRQFAPGNTNAQQAIDQALEINSKDLYLQAWKSLASDIDTLSEELMQVFQKTNKSHWLSGYISGARLDVRQAMYFEADPRLYRVLWQRKSQPKRIDPFFCLLLDRSGSMRGEKITSAFQGLVLLSEVCARLGVPLEIFSFSDDCVSELSCESTLNEATRISLGELGSKPDGQTYMGIALQQISDRMEKLHFRDKFLIVLSDGIPNDGPTVHQAIATLARQGVSCIGLGVGPETKNLQQFFREGMFEVNPHEIAHGLAYWIRIKLLQ